MRKGPANSASTLSKFGGGRLHYTHRTRYCKTTCSYGTARGPAAPATCSYNLQLQLTHYLHTDGALDVIDKLSDSRVSAAIIPKFVSFVLRGPAC